jgi:hypothetical protein
MEICYKQANFQLTKALSEEGSFEAYVAAYNNIDFGYDIIDPQAFSDEPAGKTYPYLSDHETRTVIGNWKAISDGFGVKMVDAKFNLMRDEQTGNFMVPKAAEKYANLKNGDITGFSVGYIPLEIDWKEIDGKRIRIIRKAKLMEGSVVTFPMNDKAMLISIKSLEEISALKDVEKILKDKGFSSKEAKTFISKIKKFSPRDEEESKEDQKEEVKCDALSESLSNLSKTFDEYELKKSIQNLQNLITTK